MNHPQAAVRHGARRAPVRTRLQKITGTEFGMSGAENGEEKFSILDSQFSIFHAGTDHVA